MGAAVDLGTGTQIAFLTSGFSAQVLDVTPPEVSRESVDTSHMGTAAPAAGSFGNRTFIFGKLVDGGELSFEIHFDPDDVPPIHELAEQIKITFPVPAGLTNGAEWEFPGAMTSYAPAVPLDDKMVASITVKVAGPIARTAAS